MNPISLNPTAPNPISIQLNPTILQNTTMNPTTNLNPTIDLNPTNLNPPTNIYPINPSTYPITLNLPSPLNSPKNPVKQLFQPLTLELSTSP